MKKSITIDGTRWSAIGVAYRAVDGAYEAEIVVYDGLVRYRDDEGSTTMGTAEDATAYFQNGAAWVNGGHE